MSLSSIGRSTAAIFNIREDRVKSPRLIKMPGEKGGGRDIPVFPVSLNIRAADTPWTSQNSGEGMRRVPDLL